MVTHAYNASTWKVNAGGFLVWNQPLILNKFLSKEKEKKRKLNWIQVTIPQHVAIARLLSHYLLQFPQKREPQVWVTWETHASWTQASSVLVTHNHWHSILSQGDIFMNSTGNLFDPWALGQSLSSIVLIWIQYCLNLLFL